MLDLKIWRDMETIVHKILLVGLTTGIVCVTMGCAQQDKVADNKGTYIHARHMGVGSNIPQPNRGSGASDTATVDLEREQFQQMQNNSLGRGMAGGGG